MFLRVDGEECVHLVRLTGNRSTQLRLGNGNCEAGCLPACHGQATHVETASRPRKLGFELRQLLSYVVRISVFRVEFQYSLQVLLG